ncbi:MAG TPA: hypothetical protein VHY08_12175 [Bacillota bacterium]|nr:hypothetical protein [Bacillota bacterium]
MSSKTLKMRKPSFINGMARALDLGSTFKLHDYSMGEAERIDSEIMKSDWIWVGKDIKVAINKHQRDIHGKSKMKIL